MKNKNKDKVDNTINKNNTNNNKKLSKSKKILIILFSIIVIVLLVGLIIFCNTNYSVSLLHKENISNSKEFSEESAKADLQKAYSIVMDTSSNQTITDEMYQTLKPNIYWTNVDTLSGNYQGINFYIKDGIVYIGTIPNDNNYSGGTIQSKKMENVVLNYNNKNYKNKKAFCKGYSINNINIELNSDLSYPSDIKDTDKWDMSRDQNGSIIAYCRFIGTHSVNGNTYNDYDLYIVSKTKITMPEDSSYFFADFGPYSIKGLENLDTSYVKSMQGMFYDFGNNYITSLDLSSFNTCNVTDMSYMFQNALRDECTSLNLGDNFNTSKVTTMAYMFNEACASRLQTINLGNNFDTSNVTDMTGMFYYFAYLTNDLKELNLGNKFDTSKVTKMSTLFKHAGAKSLETFSVGDKFHTEQILEGYDTFEMGDALTSIDLGPNCVKPANVPYYRTDEFLNSIVNYIGQNNCTIYCTQNLKDAIDEYCTRQHITSTRNYVVKY